LLGTFHGSWGGSKGHNFEIQRAFTVHQLLTILLEDDYSIVIVEHDPTLYEKNLDKNDKR